MARSPSASSSPWPAAQAESFFGSFFTKKERFFPATSPSYQPAERMTRRLKTVGWYLFDVARSRHTNPARIPVSDFADRYQTPPVA
jgi:hypothetical protein